MFKKLLSYLVIIILIFTKQSNASTPIILFLFSDDQCWDTIGIIGNEVETPNLDKMVKNGVFFENAYNSGAWQGAVCMASRTISITSHRQPWFCDRKPRSLTVVTTVSSPGYRHHRWIHSRPNG